MQRGGRFPAHARAPDPTISVKGDTPEMRVPSVTDVARTWLEEAIAAGKLQPGKQVKEEHIATQLGISRPPVREAFKHLEAEGLLVRKPRRGVFVAEIKEKDAWEIYTLKAELYVLSVELSFDRIGPEDLSRMRRLINAMEACLQSDPPNIVSYQELNVSFHDLHVDLARHQRLKRMLATLHNQVRYYSFQNLLNQTHLDHSCQYHRRIYEAFEIGDRQLAQQLTREHVLAALGTLESRYQYGRLNEPHMV